MKPILERPFAVSTVYLPVNVPGVDEEHRIFPLGYALALGRRTTVCKEA